MLGVNCVEIVILEKLHCILSKRATRPICMKIQVWLNAINSYQSQQLSLVIPEITISGHTRHKHLQPDQTQLQLRPVHSILPLLLYTVEQETK